MYPLSFRLSAPLKLPNQRGIAANRKAGAAQIARERVALATEIMALTHGKRPLAPLPKARVRVYRCSVGEPDTDNLYASAKALLDCLQPSNERRKYGLGIIENDRPSQCELRVHHVKAAGRAEQCTIVMIEDLS